MRGVRLTPRVYRSLVACAIAAAFALDVYLPWGTAGWLTHLAPLALVVRRGTPRALLVVGGACSALTLGKLLWIAPPPAAEALPVVLNRGAGAAGLAFSAWAIAGRLSALERLWAHGTWQGRPDDDGLGRLERMTGAVQEVTEAKETQQQVHGLSRELLRAQDEERRRIAKDLHDTTAQELAAALLSLDSLRTDLAGRPEAIRRLDDGLGLLEKSVSDIRTLSYVLHPPGLDTGLASAIRLYVDGFARRTGIRISLDLDDRLDHLPTEARLKLLRVCQEALGNVARHSRSPTVAIRLVCDDTAIRLEVRDAGVGMPPDALERPGETGSVVGVGLPAMRERLQQIGGRFEIDSGRHGTTVRAILPQDAST